MKYETNLDMGEPPKEKLILAYRLCLEMIAHVGRTADLLVPTWNNRFLGISQSETISSLLRATLFLRVKEKARVLVQICHVSGHPLDSLNSVEAKGQTGVTLVTASLNLQLNLIAKIFGDAIEHQHIDGNNLAAFIGALELECQAAELDLVNIFKEL